MPAQLKPSNNGPKLVKRNAAATPIPPRPAPMTTLPSRLVSAYRPPANRNHLTRIIDRPAVARQKGPARQTGGCR